MTSVLVVLIGLPGSGKTTLANWLVRHSPIVVVSRDTIRAAMFPECEYTPTEKRAAFRAMQEAVGINLSLGKSVCTDGLTFANEEDRVAIRQVAQVSGSRTLEVHCAVPVSVAQERVVNDTDTVFPDRNAEAVLEVAGRFTPVSAETVRLDMTRPTVDVGQELIEAIVKAGS
jgi:predicted kinase